MIKFLKNLIALFIGLIISLITVELILRIYNPFPSVVKGDKIILRCNSMVEYNNLKNSKLSKTIYVSTNSLGFRGDNPPRDFNNYLTILTVGGSTTHCYYNSDDKTWPYDLAKDLDKNFNRIWVNNAGLSGHTTMGHIILMQDYIIKIKPKIVLFLVGINDLGDPKESGSYNTFTLYNFDNESLKAKLKAFLYKSELVGLTVNISRKIKAARRNLDYYIDFDLKKAEHLTLTDSQIQKVLNLYNDAYFVTYRQRLLKLIELCRQNNIEPIFITQPVLYGKGIDKETSVDLATIKVSNNKNGLLEGELVDLVNQNTARVARENGVFLVDLSSKMPKDSRYYFDLIHFTDEGNEVIAKIISDQLTPYLQAWYKQFVKK